MMNDYSSFDNPFILQAPTVDKDDIDQEMELLKLQGVRVSRRIVTLRLSQNAEATFQGDPGSIASPITTRSLPPHEVVNQLIEWAIEQSAEVSRAVLDFLAEPDDDQLDDLVARLKKSGAIARKSPPKAKNGMLSQVLFTYISEKARTREELYAYARTLHQAERPEAAVRQYLRRAVREETLTLTEGYYYVNQ